MNVEIGTETPIFLFWGFEISVFCLCSVYLSLPGSLFSCISVLLYLCSPFTISHFFCVFPILNVNRPFWIARHHRAVANIAERSLRHCQCWRAFIEPLPTENNNILGLKCSLRHWKQIPNLVIAPLPTAVWSELKAADRAVCAVCNLFPNSQQP